MCATHFDKPQPYCGNKNLQLHYRDTDSFVLGLNTNDIVEDLRSFNELFDFSNLNKYH